MEKSKLLTISVFGLLLLNLATLGFLFLHGPKGHRPPPQGNQLQPREVIINQLHFDAAQQKDYTKIIQIHQDAIRELDNNIRQTKNDLYALLSDSQVNVKTKDSLINVLNAYQKQINETHFKHFEDIKKLCHPDQMEDFNTLTGELGRIFTPNRIPRH
ncbi:MAG: hypothetical protein RL427_1695 [Bacteroidota bacterium]|jgi:Spy/CpxP family protein refolding chaperone